MYEPAGFEPLPRKGMSKGAKIGIGCGVTALLLILVCGGLIWYAVRHFLNEAKAFAADFESRGYVRQSSQTIDVNQPLNQSTVFLAQYVRVNAPVVGNLAFATQTAEINANVDGDIDFWGQVLTISPNVVVTGDVRVKLAQVVDIKGTVQGQVSGNVPPSRQPKTPSQPSPPAPPQPADTAPPAEDTSTTSPPQPPSDD